MKIFVTRKIPGEHLKKLSTEGNEVEVSKFDRPLKAEEFEITRLTKQSRLRWVLTGVAYDDDAGS